MTTDPHRHDFLPWLFASEANDEQRRQQAQWQQALLAWQPAAGFAFSPAALPGTDEHRPSLMGTEMWLAIVWLLADVLGDSGALGYRPRGIHRPEAAH